ncbi:hypothetical protein Tco_1545300, partial [Tanacetum coccineum]
FDELMSTPTDFSAYIMNNLKIDNLTQEHHNNPEGQEYPFDLSKLLPLIKDQGRQVVLVGYFIKNDLEYLKGGSPSRKYMTSTTKTNAAKYDDIQDIKDMVPSLWSPVKVAYDRYAVWGITHWDYGYLQEIKVRREDQNLYKFKEGDFPRLNLRDIEDMLLLLVQKKIANLERDVIFDLNVALRMFTKRDGLLAKEKMEYFRQKRSRIMIKAINKLQLERRLMRNLEKFVGGREYKEYFRLLEWTI